jgi:hypothetical protein
MEILIFVRFYRFQNEPSGKYKQASGEQAF